MPGNPFGRRGLKGSLLAKSLDAFVLSVEIANRISCQYRTEAFCSLLVNAWELLSKARIIDNAGTPKSVFRSKKGGKKRESLSLGECITRLKPELPTPVVRNLEFVKEIRDEATHLVIPGLPRQVAELMQACVLNYATDLEKWFDVSVSSRVPAGLMSIVYSVDRDDHSPDATVLSKRYGKDVGQFLWGLQERIDKESEAFLESSQFRVSIGLKLCLVRSPAKADLLIGSGSEGRPLYINVPKDPAVTHPHRQKEVVVAVGRVLGVSVNAYDVQCVIATKLIKSKANYHFRSGATWAPDLYSQEFVDYLVSSYRSDKEFFAKARNKMREQLRSSRSRVPANANSA